MTKQKAFLFRILLLLGDLAAILLFVFLGQQDHDTTDPNNPLLGLLKAAFPLLLITWLVVALRGASLPQS
jgi:hypothetical protein